VPLADDALTDVASLRAWLGEEDAEEEACEDAINGVSRNIRNYLDRQLVPFEEDAEKRFLYDGSGFLELLGTELRFGAGVSDPVITLYVDMPVSEQVVLSAGDASSEADYRLEPRGGTLEDTYLSIILPRLDPKTLTSSSYALEGEDKQIEVKIVGDWGAGVVPGSVKLAANVAASEAYRNPEAGEDRQLGPLSIDSDDTDDFAFGLSKRVRAMLKADRRVALAGS
jgi:hypothetical protein